MKMKLVTLLTFSVATQLAAFAADVPDKSYRGEAYAYPASGKSLFNVERRWISGPGQQALTEVFKTGAGETAVSLETTYRHEQLATIRFEQQQAGEKAIAEFRDGRVFYFTTINGKTKASNEPVSGDWVAFNAVPDEVDPESWTAGDGIHKPRRKCPTCPRNDASIVRR